MVLTLQNENSERIHFAYQNKKEAYQKPLPCSIIIIISAT
jgi:hypothetical protein